MSYLAAVPAVRPWRTLTFAGEINRALDESMGQDKNVVVCGQLVKYGVAGLTTGLYEKYPEQVVTYPVSESLMNSSAMGLALAGKRTVMIHVRIDFLACGMDALVNHIPIWSTKGVKLPLVIVCQIGKGMGQAAQHSKNLTYWFEAFEVWTVKVPYSPIDAYRMMVAVIFGDKPVLYVIHRELFDSNEERYIPPPQRIRLCGASRRHEAEFYK